METYRQYFNILGEAVNHDLYRLVLSKREYFTHSKTSPSKVYPDWRKSTVIYDDQLVDVATKLEREIRLRLPEVMAALQIPAFEIGSFEIQLTSHNDGEYYKWHTDSGSPDTAARVITFVYYLHSLPRKFRGGELLIHLPDQQHVTIEPENDSMVFFRSRTKHEVKEVICESQQFEDGRFTFNGWIRRKAPVRRDDYFDYRIFTPPRRAGAAVAKPVAGYASQRRAATPESLLNLYSDLHRQSGQAATIDVLPSISRTEFYENYYFRNRPVLLKNVAHSPAALRNWSPAFFTQNYGSVPVEITGGRNSFRDYEARFRQTLETIPMAEFVKRLEASGETNDFYIVARNYFFENPALKPLRSDLQPPPEIINVEDHGPGTVKLWFGPKGTVTPLHYDEHSILFAQIYGRKRFKLIPSFDLPKVYCRDRFYSSVDPENVDEERYPLFLQASVSEVTVEPGDLLFLPVGWWHWAKSVDVSISATFCSFHVEGRNTTLSR